MSQRTFQICIAALGIGFALYFFVNVLPPLIADPDIMDALAAGFVNPYAAGYSTDAVLCWMILAVWVIYEARQLKIRHGWIALLLGLAPGVATGFALYLLLRQRQLKEVRAQ